MNYTTVAKEAILKYPELTSQIMDLVQLCVDEIEQGGSPTHESNLCIESIEQLIEEHNGTAE